MKSKFLMILSLLLLGVALIGLVMYRFMPAEAGTSQASSTKTITYEVWETRHSLSPGDPVSRQDLRLAKISQEAAFNKGIKANVTLPFVAGMVANTPLNEAAIIMPENITQPNQDGYFRLVMTPGHVPFPINVNQESVVGGVIQSGSKIDVLALTSRSQNLASEGSIRDFKSISLTPILMGVNVLQVKEDKSGLISTGSESKKASLILELTPKQVATLTIAKNIAKLEVHVSTGESSPSALSANVGDVIPGYTAVREFRPNTGSSIEGER